MENFAPRSVLCTPPHPRPQHFNHKSFRSDILAQPWDDLKRVHNPNEMCLKWKTLLLGVSYVHPCNRANS